MHLPVVTKMFVLFAAMSRLAKYNKDMAVDTVFKLPKVYDEGRNATAKLHIIE